MSVTDELLRNAERYAALIIARLALAALETTPDTSAAKKRR